MRRDDLLRQFNDWFEPDKYRDFGENGLQVEGSGEIHRIVCGVTANQKLIDQAVRDGADAIFVHHGIVWGGGMRSLTGWLGQRVRTLMKNDISLFAYHLPLDAHATLGNNAGLADAVGLGTDRIGFGDVKGQTIGVMGDVDCTLDAVTKRVVERVGQPLCVFGDPKKTVRRVGICSGGAPDLLHEAIERGLDLYITGEVSEWVMSVAEESGVAFIAAGHHQTERFGAQRVARALVKHGLHATFVDVENPA